MPRKITFSLLVLIFTLSFSCIVFGNEDLSAQWVANRVGITFDANGGSNPPEPKMYIYGMSGTLPGQESMTRAGYTFGGWGTSSDATEAMINTSNTAFELADTSNTEKTLYAIWVPSTPVVYTVKHYQMNIDGVNYTLVNTENKTGIPGTQVTPEVMDYSGFTAPAIQTQIIESDGSLVVEYYYTRNKYTQTTQVRYENADGSFGNYTTVDTKEVYFGDSYGYSQAEKTVSGVPYQSATLASYTVMGETSTHLDIYRKTFTLTLTKDDGVLNVSGEGTYRYGESVTISAEVNQGFTWVNWTGTSTLTAQSVSITITGNASYKANTKANEITLTLVKTSSIGDATTISKIESYKPGSTSPDNTYTSISVNTPYKVYPGGKVILTHDSDDFWNYLDKNATASTLASIKSSAHVIGVGASCFFTVPATATGNANLNIIAAKLTGNEYMLLNKSTEWAKDIEPALYSSAVNFTITNSTAHVKRIEIYKPDETTPVNVYEPIAVDTNYTAYTGGKVVLIHDSYYSWTYKDTAKVEHDLGTGRCCTFSVPSAISKDATLQIAYKTASSNYHMLDVLDMDNSTGWFKVAVPAVSGNDYTNTNGEVSFKLANFTKATKIECYKAGATSPSKTYNSVSLNATYTAYPGGKVIFTRDANYGAVVFTWEDDGINGYWKHLGFGTKLQIDVPKFDVNETSFEDATLYAQEYTSSNYGWLDKEERFIGIEQANGKCSHGWVTNSLPTILDPISNKEVCFYFTGNDSAKYIEGTPGRHITKVYTYRKGESTPAHVYTSIHDYDDMIAYTGGKVVFEHSPAYWIYYDKDHAKHNLGRGSKCYFMIPTRYPDVSRSHILTSVITNTSNEADEIDIGYFDTSRSWIKDVNIYLGS